MKGSAEMLPAMEAEARKRQGARNDLRNIPPRIAECLSEAGNLPVPPRMEAPAGEAAATAAALVGERPTQRMEQAQTGCGVTTAEQAPERIATALHAERLAGAALGSLVACREGMGGIPADQGHPRQARGATACSDLWNS
jgi:hypothetical protein